MHETMFPEISENLYKIQRPLVYGSDRLGKTTHKLPIEKKPTGRDLPGTQARFTHYLLEYCSTTLPNEGLNPQGQLTLESLMNNR